MNEIDDLITKVESLVKNPRLCKTTFSYKGELYTCVNLIEPPLTDKDMSDIRYFIIENNPGLSRRGLALEGLELQRLQDVRGLLQANDYILMDAIEKQERELTV